MVSQDPGGDKGMLPRPRGAPGLQNPSGGHATSYNYIFPMVTTVCGVGIIDAETHGPIPIGFVQRRPCLQESLF